jgi:hypothetical protein
MSLQDEKLDELIFNGHLIPAVKHIRDTTGKTIDEALGDVHRRFNELSKSTPEKFKVSIQGCFGEYYS